MNVSCGQDIHSPFLLDPEVLERPILRAFEYSSVANDLQKGDVSLKVF